MAIAIITGASSGLGSEFVQQVSEKKKPNEIWVIARRKERLSALARSVKTPLRILPMDVTSRENMEKLRHLLAEEKPEVSLLVHAAGMGKIGSYEEIGREKAMAIVRLNCEAAVDVTESVLPYMHRGARIIEIASTSAFQPFQGLNVYAASKAFLLRYTRGLAVELSGTGIRATAVCPYWISDTEFIGTASETGSRKIRHFPLASKKRSVAALSLLASDLGLPVCTPGVICTGHRLISVLPDTVLQGMWALIRRI